MARRQQQQPQQQQRARHAFAMLVVSLAAAAALAPQQAAAFKAMKCVKSSPVGTLKVAPSYEKRLPVTRGERLDPGECQTWILDTSSCTDAG